MRLPINDLLPGTQYAIQCRAVTPDNISEWSARFILTTADANTLPDVPLNIVWYDSGDSFYGEWDSVTTNSSGQPANIVRYEIELTAGAQVVVISHVQNTDGRVKFPLSFDDNKTYFGTAKPSIEFRVRSVDNKGLKSVWSSSILATNPVPLPPSAPVVLEITDGVDIKWTPSESTDVSKYYIYASTSSSEFVPAPANRVGITSSPHFVHNTATYSLHYYRIRAVDVFEQESNDLLTQGTPKTPFTVDTTPPAAPTSFAVNIVDGDGLTLFQRAEATWNYDNTDATITGFHLRYKKSADLNWTVISIPPDPSFPIVIDNLDPNVAYDFSVRAFDMFGNKTAWVNLSTNASAPTYTPEITHAIIIGAGGYVKSQDYIVGGTTGFYLDSDSFIVNNGQINGRAITTGLIRSTDPALDAAGAPIPGEYAWQIDLEGDAVFGNAKVRGNVVVGQTGETQTSRMQSYNYSAGTTGWAVDSNGFAEFRNLASDIIHAEQIHADAIETEYIRSALSRADLIIAGKIKTAEDGARIEMGTDGIFLWGTTGTEPIIKIPTDGSPAKFTGNADIDFLTVKTLTTLQTSELSSGSTMTLMVGTTPPGNPPTASSVYGNVWVSGVPLLQGGKTYSRGLTITGSDTYMCIHGVRTSEFAGGRVIKFPTTGGAVTATYTLTNAAGTVIDPIDLKWQDGKWWVLARKKTPGYVNTYEFHVIRYDANFNRTGESEIPVAGNGSTGTNAIELYEYTATGIEVHSDDFLYILRAHVNTDAVGVLRVSKSTGARTLFTSPSTAATTDYSSDNTDLGYGISIGVFDFGSTRWLIPYRGASDKNIRGYAQSGTTLVRYTDSDFPASGNPRAFDWDPASSTFKSVSGYDLSGGGFTFISYSGIDATLTTLSTTKYASYTWRKSDGLGGFYETTESPRAAFTFNKRAWVSVNTSSIPNNGGAADPDHSRIFLGNGNAITNMWLNATGSAGQTAYTISSPAFYSGSNPPAAGNFPNSTAAKIQSKTGTLVLRADGTAQLGDLSVDSGGKVSVNPGTSGAHLARRDDLIRERVQLYRNANQSIPNAGGTKRVTTWLVDSDAVGNWQFNGADIIVPVTGTYYVTATVNFAPGGAGRRYVSVQAGGTELFRAETHASTTTYSGMTASGQRYLGAGTVLNVHVYQESGASLDIIPNGNNFAAHRLM